MRPGDDLLHDDDHDDPTPHTPRPPRAPMRAAARLRLMADRPDAVARAVTLRDVAERSAGLDCPAPLPVGYGGWLELVDPRGRPLRLGVTLIRCRAKAGGGGYDAAASFRQRQPALLAAALDAARLAA